jgi:hypothetical protein
MNNLFRDQFTGAADASRVIRICIALECILVNNNTPLLAKGSIRGHAAFYSAGKLSAFGFASSPHVFDRREMVDGDDVCLLASRSLSSHHWTCVATLKA